jgi:murein DD-endopeptidase MepM/ murein hydrolase activator NlpD
MQGFLTLPFRCEDASKIYEYHGFDHDPRVGFVMDYRGDTTMSGAPGQAGWPGEPGTGDQHQGDDFGVPVGTFTVASMSGVLTHEFISTDNQARVARLENKAISDRPGYFSVLVYGHHSVPLVAGVPSVWTGDGTTVYRGQIIQLSGSTGTGWPHLHLSYCGNAQPGLAEDFQCYDSHGVEFATENDLDTMSAWTVYNNPQCYP